VRLLLTLISIAPLVILPAPSIAFDLEQSLRELAAPSHSGFASEGSVKTNDGMSLSEAIESVRRQTGGRIISARTKVSGNREVHHIKVLMQDGKVRTVKVSGRSRRD